MTAWRDWLPPLSLCFIAGAAQAVEVGVATLADAGTRVLRGATWYKLVPGAALEDGDIVAAGQKLHVQGEFAAGNVVSFAGEGSMYLTTGKDGALLLDGPGRRRSRLWSSRRACACAPRRSRRASTKGSWSCVQARTARRSSSRRAAPGWPTRARPPSCAKRSAASTGTSRRGASRPSRSRPSRSSTPCPRNFLDPLPVLAARIKSKPVLVVDHEVTYAEAEPWLARDRAVFEKRFVSRLRDPAFRKAVEPVRCAVPVVGPHAASREVRAEAASGTGSGQPQK